MVGISLLTLVPGEVGGAETYPAVSAVGVPARARSTTRRSRRPRRRAPAAASFTWEASARGHEDAYRATAQ